MGEQWARMVKKRTQAYHLQRRVCFYCKFHLELKKARGREGTLRRSFFCQEDLPGRKNEY